MKIMYFFLNLNIFKNKVSENEKTVFLKKVTVIFTHQFER